MLRLLFALIIAFGWAAAQAEVITIVDESPINSPFQYWEDTGATATLAQVQALPEDQWQFEPSGNAAMGITTSAYWLRFSIRNDTARFVNLVTELGYSQLDDVSFFVFSGNEQVHEFQTGDTRPFYPREVDHPNMLMRFNLQPGQEKTLYIRAVTAGSMILPLQIWRENAFFAAASTEQKFHFFYYGSLTVILLINLAVFLTLREKLYLYYALAIFGYLLYFAAIKGFSFQIFYPHFPGLHARVLLISMPLLALFSILFCRELLKTKQHSPKLDKALLGMLCFEISFLFAAQLMSYQTAITWSAISALLFFSLLFVAGPITWMAGVRAGAFFTVAWTPLTVGVLATSGLALGVLPENMLTENAMQLGSGMEAFILTLALADRLYREREEKIRAQADTLFQEKARNEAHQRLTEAMTHDPVTGLPNRNRFERMVNRQLAEDPAGHYLVGVARITRLDEINRTLGLNRSERLLRRMAEQMSQLASNLASVQSCLDEQGREERVYQLSGDCFGVLVNANKVADRFDELNNTLRLLSKPVILDGLAIEPHPKFGASSYPSHGDNAALLIRNAHVGMEITPHGQLETGFYSKNHDIYSESRLTLMSDLREALQQNTTELYYQPKACLASGRIVGLEALIRWHHPERGAVSPAEFIPLAEETGVISQLTRWAVDRGAADLAHLLKNHPQLGVSINISARDLVSGELKGTIEQTLARHQVKADQLTLELTETAAMEDPALGLRALQTLADVGLRVSIDDFGSGYSSLSYLKRLPATELKLDQSLILDVDDSDSSKVIVQTAINMAHGLGYDVVAEGVENEETANLLKIMGCDKVQGYWLCRPLPLPELEAWLAEYHARFSSPCNTG
ncbi:EAL domain-containing protein [Marinobacter zhejiangensis]|uniref:Diguanylate cyclase/phosphodiesterase n=1 Tax=Marinobacter zhejiangensis TaxID=488535 RepID=A0A1I4Q179_9GAMM|nr:EAL domain-containing protein [Marinobacter zhejiangensis]SFM33832.1 diguanylate cyclase/phosphodiesterase [Marinobacter zhejiangensis]